jgi:hypothetical protein
LCAQPGNLKIGGDIQRFWKTYLTIEDVREAVIDKGATQVSFPNTMTTISEVDRVPMEQVLRRVLSNTILDWIGFLGFFGVAIFKWRVLLPLLPMLVLGVLSFQSVCSANSLPDYFGWCFFVCIVCTAWEFKDWW